MLNDDPQCLAPVMLVIFSSPQSPCWTGLHYPLLDDPLLMMKLIDHPGQLVHALYWCNMLLLDLLAEVSLILAVIMVYPGSWLLFSWFYNILPSICSSLLKETPLNHSWNHTDTAITAFHKVEHSFSWIEHAIIGWMFSIHCIIFMICLALGDDLRCYSNGWLICWWIQLMFQMVHWSKFLFLTPVVLFTRCSYKSLLLNLGSLSM